MKIYDLKTMTECSIEGNTVVALGNFDGCHNGHMSVVMKAFYEAKAKKARSVVYTFEKMPKNTNKCILTLDEKIKFIRKAGIDYIAIDDFFSVKDKSGNEFFEEILIGKLNSVGAVCGFNYRFGKNASCGAQDLAIMYEKNGGSVAICDKILYEGVPVSSTLIRELIKNGDVEAVSRIAPPYSVKAMVLEGKKLGRTIGAPTINQQIPDEKVVPQRGVYITECEIGEDVYPAVTNVGLRPTVESADSVNMETHIIGYNGILYSSYIRVNFYKKIRDEIKFQSVEALKEQISKDIEEATLYFR